MNSRTQLFFWTYIAIFPPIPQSLRTLMIVVSGKVGHVAVGTCTDIQHCIDIILAVGARSLAADCNMSRDQALDSARISSKVHA